MNFTRKVSKLLEKTSVRDFSQNIQKATAVQFLPARCYARVVPAVVCQSVCQSQAGTVQKRLKIGSRKQCNMIAQGL